MVVSCIEFVLIAPRIRTARSSPLRLPPVDPLDLRRRVTLVLLRKIYINYMHTILQQSVKVHKTFVSEIKAYFIVLIDINNSNSNDVA